MKGGSTKKKLAIGLAAGGGITLFVGIIIIIFIIGLFKISEPGRTHCRISVRAVYQAAQHH